ncbi:MAG: segregation/condensation protein A, partial [Thermodesulfovibrionia bacterium]|nr:segregation/condensation protein A [Thermodesulfovibrionia bacterium]
TTNNTRLTFSTLVPSETKEDKIYTFIPLLHLTNQRKIDIEQYQPFGEIEIILRQKIELDKELNSGIEA